MTRARDIVGIDYYCQLSDVDLLQELVSGLPRYAVCVNIGAAFGTSTLAMLETRRDTYVISIDVAECAHERKALEESGLDYVTRYLRLLMPSQDAAEAWRFGKVDLVFVDGGHSFDDCYGDIRKWYRHVNIGGIVAVHDYEADMLADIKPATDQAASELGLQEIAHEGKLIAFRKV